jgi:processive 1,2-diacylglycerol beta-glucosyltransferase
MVPVSILIVTAGFGEGHNAAARNIEEAIKKFHPEILVSVHDFFREAHPWIYPVAQWTYKTAIRRVPWAWNLFYQFLDRFPGVSSVGLGFYRRAARRMRDTILRMEAGIVVSTFPGYGPIFKRAVRKFNLRLPFATIITDSISINSIWLESPSDAYFVPNEPTAKVLEKKGAPRAKIRVTGFPVPLFFATPPVKPREVPPSDGIWKILYMVNSEGNEALETARGLLALENIALTVTCGRDKNLALRIQNLADEMGRLIEVLGWVSEMPYLIRRSHLLIGKAGGATVQEAMAAHTPMVVTKVVPGQEEGNARLLVERGAGVVATTPAAVAQSVRRIFESGGSQYLDLLKAASSLSHPAAAKDIANLVSSLCRRV